MKHILDSVRPSFTTIHARALALAGDIRLHGVVAQREMEKQSSPLV
jgi:hypothetical protein